LKIKLPKRKLRNVFIVARFTKELSHLKDLRNKNTALVFAWGQTRKLALILPNTRKNASIVGKSLEDQPITTEGSRA